MFICGQCSFPSFNGNEHAHYTFFPRLCVHSVYTCQLCRRVWGRHLYGSWVSAWRHSVEGVLGGPTHAPALLSVQWFSKPQLLLEVIFLLTFCFQWSDDGVLKADSTLLFWGLYTSLRVRWCRKPRMKQVATTTESFAVAAVHFSNYD